MKILILIFLTCTVVAAETLVGKAINSDGKFVYTEEHSIERGAGGLTKHVETLYFDPQGKKIAKMVSEFSDKISAPDSKFEDFRFDRIFEGKFFSEDSKKIYRISEFKSGKLVKTTDLVYREDLVSGPGFDNYIKENIVRKKSTSSSVHFLVLPRHDYFRFEVIDKGLTSGNSQTYVIKPSMVLSLFVKAIEIDYDAKTGVLKKYVGLSNLPSEKDESQSVTIDYQAKSSLKAGTP